VQLEASPNEGTSTLLLAYADGAAAMTAPSDDERKRHSILGLPWRHASDGNPVPDRSGHP
jgi:hypothetical protein